MTREKPWPLIELPSEEVADDATDEEFWTSLPSVIDREKHILAIPAKPSRSFPGKTTRSRLELLEQAAMHRKDYP